MMDDETQKRIEDICREYKTKMQRLVNRKGSKIDRVSMTVGDKTVVIAEKRRAGKKIERK